MADSQESLTVVIKADTGSATTNISAFEARLAALEKAYTASTAATTAHTAAHIAAAPAITRTGEAATGASAAMGILDKNVRVVSMGMNAAGMEASAAGVKIAALTGIVESAEAVFGPLIIAILAFEAAMRAFSFVNDARQAASEFQAQMETLGASITTQAGNFNVAQGQIKDWAASEAMASGILQAQLIPALNDLVTAGHSVADSETILAVAEEVAISHHKQVGEVVGDLIALELGRARGIEKLDLGVKALVDRHATLAEILEYLHQKNAKAIEDDQSAERAHARLNAEIEAISLTIGNELLPSMANMSYAFLGTLKNVELFGEGFVTVFKAIPVIVEGAVTSLKALPDALAAGFNALTHGNIGGAAAAMSAAAKADISAGMALLSAGGNIQGVGEQEMLDGLTRDAGTVGRHTAGAAVKKHLAALDSRIAEVQAVAPPKGAKAAGAGAGGQSLVDVTHLDDSKEKSDELKVALMGLEGQIHANDDAEKKLKSAIELATTEAGKSAAQAAYDAQMRADLTSKVAAYEAELQREDQVEQSLMQRRAQAELQVHDYAVAVNYLKDRLAEKGKLSDDENLVMVNLTGQYNEAKKTVAALSAEIDKNTTAFNANVKAQRNAQDALDGYADAADKAAAKAALALEKLGNHYTDFVAKEKRALDDGVAILGMSTTQKLAWYQREADAVVVTDAKTLAEKEAYNQKANGLTIQLFTEQKAAHDNFIATWEGRETSWLDGLIKGTTSLKDTLSNIWATIFDDFAKMIEKMILESALLKGLNSTIAGFFGMAASGGGSPSFLSAIPGFGGGGTGGKAGPDGSSGDPLHVITAAAGAPFLQGVTGSPTGVSSGSFSALSGGGGAAAFAPLVAAGIGSALLGGKLGQAIGGGAGGGAVGGLGAILAAGGIEGLMTGSGLMGGLGAFGAAGPWGIAALAAIGIGGAILGSGGFGPHETAAQQPDTSNPAWGQVDVNWNGAPGAQTFGNQQFTASSQYNVGQGGTPEYKLMENWANAGAATTDAQKALAAQIKGLEGGNPNSDFGIIREAQGTAFLANGQTMKVTDLIAMEQAFQANVGGASGPIPTFSVARSYPDFTAGTLSPTGMQPSGGTVVTPGTTPAPTAVNITVQGSVVTPSDLIDAIATGLAQRGIGLSASSPAPRFVVTSSF